MTSLQMMDREKLEEAALDLQKNPSALGELASDPVGFLKRFGVEVDQETADTIQKQLSDEASPDVNAGVSVHIDL